MKLLQLSTFYSAYLRQWRSKNPGATRLPYAEQKSLLMEDCFGWADTWERGLTLRGWEAECWVANDENLREAWCREHGFVPGPDALGACALEKLRQSRPDILLIEDFNAFRGDFIRQARATHPKLRAVVVHCGAAWSDDSAFRLADLVITCIGGLVETFAAMAPRARLLHHAFDPQVTVRLQQRGEASTARDLGLIFTGQVAPGAGFHEKRRVLLEELTRNVDVGLYLPGTASPWRHGWNRLLRALCRRTPGLGAMAPENLPLIEPSFRALHHKAVYGLDMYALLARASAVLNNHVDLAGPWASNMRLFEATGMGACLLTDAKQNLGKLFETGKEIVAYEGTTDALEKARWLAEHPAQAAAIGEAGQRRTLRDHTWDRRLEEFEGMVREFV